MAGADQVEAVTRAFTGHGVDEKSLISILGNWSPEERKAFRQSTPRFFSEDERQFERWDDHCVRLLKHEFMRFKNAVVLWALHPWERDARLVKEALQKGVKIQEAYGVIIEIACTRSADELLGARTAYHSLFDHSMEEDVASNIQGIERKLLVPLVCAYRYEGSNVKDDTAKSEAETLAHVIKHIDTDSIMENSEVIRILTTRSKPHLYAIYNHYKELTGRTLDQDLDGMRLKEALQCLCTPQTYFSEVLNASLRMDDKDTNKALARVIVTRADVDINEIKEEYCKLYGVSLSKKIDETAQGSYRDFLLTLVEKEN